MNNSSPNGVKLKLEELKWDNLLFRSRLPCDPRIDMISRQVNSAAMAPPKIAILGAGIFVKTEYIPRLSQITDLFVLDAIWSRTEESASGAVDIAHKFFPCVRCKWGDSGLDEIIQDDSIHAVLVVLAAPFQVDLSLKLLKAGKHVLQEKPAAASIGEVDTVLSCYNSLPSKPIWGVAENFRFEPAFMEGRKLVSDIGDLVNFQFIVEVPMNSSNPYFSTSWRHSFTGGYILDMGVHFIAVLRMVVGCEVTSVSAATSHVDDALPPPDSMSSVIQLENGCSGVLVTVVSAKTLKMLFRVVGLKGTLQIELEKGEEKFGYTLNLFTGDGLTKTCFYPISGVTEELKTFFNNVTQASLKRDCSFHCEPQISFIEGARDVAVLDAMLESGKRMGALVQVHKF